MTSDRIQRNIERLLDEADQAFTAHDWAGLQGCAEDVLSLDPENREAQTFLGAAERNLSLKPVASIAPTAEVVAERAEIPVSFASGRYTVKRFLGEGGKKKVYLAHDTLLDRDVAFALIKTEGLDDVGRDRITREAQAMGRLGAHPYIVSVFDLGTEVNGQPYIVTELMRGGDVEGLIDKAPEHRLPLERTLEIGVEVCRGLEFAHSHGIVHRDLKPGNVWLTEEGTAKLGDFGLAVALDKSRLTQAGMMVGTVSYMPPEQAMGGEVTAQSDLYALGAMLYEMVTGRPPFIGDESVAIITQHLNSAPVSPSWHRRSLSPALETLILRLLEKDPGKRPATAADVRATLESIVRAPEPTVETNMPDAVTAAPADSNPIYRSTFVGRESELLRLQTALDAAVSGQGSLAMIVGEPGIGKTSLCEQLGTYVAVRGGRTLVGHCYEEGSLSLPYLPFVEAMRSYVLAREPDGLQKDLGSGAGEVARIVSEVRDRVPVSLDEAGDPNEQRWRLLQAVTVFLRNASFVQPLLLILEDLHDADRGTLDLLVHLARSLEGARLLIVGTYRDVEVDRSHPLSGALAELRRGQNFQRVLLRGLTAEEVQRMMAAVAQREIPWPFAELVHRQTEGNPLFAQEMLRYLVEEGLVAERGRVLQRVGDDTLAGRIPEGLRDVIGKRLSRLGEQTNQVLSIASVAGREFRLDVLQRVAALPEETVEAALEEASGVAVVEQRTGVGGQLSFRFTHAFFRQTLYEELFAARRIRLHQQVARALEAVYGRRVEEHAAELAEHYANSSDPADLRKAVAYGEMAARRAMSVFAYGEAVRHYENALKAQEVLDPDDAARRCDLLLALSEAMLPAEEPVRVASGPAEQAFGLAEALGDNIRAARAAVLALESMDRSASLASTLGGAGAQTWADRADRYAAEGTRERILADAYIGVSRLQVTGPVSAHPYLRKAAEAALTTSDQAAFYKAAGLTLRQLLAVCDRDFVQTVADAVMSRPRAGAPSGDLGICLTYLGAALLERGNRKAAERAWAEMNELAERTRDAGQQVNAHSAGTLLARLDGRLEEAVTLADVHAALAEELGVTPFTGLTGIYPLVYLGREQEVLASRFVANPRGRPHWAVAAWCLAQLHHHGEAQPFRERFGDLSAESDETGSALLAALMESAVLDGNVEFVRAVRPRIAGMARFACAGITLLSWPRILGAAAALLGEREQARALYEQAFESSGLLRNRPELALTHLQLAELLLENGDGTDREEALHHLDTAIAEFREMKMQPSLERALRHKDVLKA